MALSDEQNAMLRLLASGEQGYGDIAAKSHLARLLVSSQILLDVMFVAVILRQRRKQIEQRRRVSITLNWQLLSPWP